MKTVDEMAQIKADEYAGQSYLKDANPISYEGLEAPFCDGFKAGVEFAQSWISVKDELPEDGQYCLVKLSDGTELYAQMQILRWVIFWYGGAGAETKERPVEKWRPIEYK